MDALSSARLMELKAHHSLKDVQAYSLYSKFTEIDRAYKHDAEGYFEEMRFLDNTKILEIFQNGEGSKLGLDRSSETWFFEWWNGVKTVKLWRNGEHEWGEIVDKSSGSEVREKWNLWGLEESYEYYNLEDSNEYGSKAGVKGGTQWKEIWWRKPDESLLEKFWIEGANRWGIKEGQHGGRTWREEWSETENKKETKTFNENEGRRWGDCKGTEGNLQWNEVWEDFGDRKTNNKWWSQGSRRWGIKDIREGIHQYVEEWEENDGKFRKVETTNDGLGNKTQKTTGHGPGYRFSDVFTENLSKGERSETKSGLSPDGSWETQRKEQNGEHLVQHKGFDINGTWEETWYEKGGIKWAKKQGESRLFGKWDENWSTDEKTQHAQKHGVNHENEWWEEWTEGEGRKKCRKEQRKPGLTKIQWWEEETYDNERHTWGEFIENDVVVKKWDDRYRIA